MSLPTNLFIPAHSLGEETRAATRAGKARLFTYGGQGACVAVCSGSKQVVMELLPELKQAMRRYQASTAILVLPSGYVRTYAMLDRAALARQGIAVRLAKTKQPLREAQALAKAIESGIAEALQHLDSISP